MQDSNLRLPAKVWFRIILGIAFVLVLAATIYVVTTLNYYYQAVDDSRKRNLGRAELSPAATQP